VNEKTTENIASILTKIWAPYPHVTKYNLSMPLSRKRVYQTAKYWNYDALSCSRCSIFYRLMAGAYYGSILLTYLSIEYDQFAN